MKARTWLFALCIATPVCAQFKEIGPPPFPPAIAHQKIRTLLETADANNRKQTVTTLSNWLAWYRDILDEEIIAAWRKDSRANLPEVIESLSDKRIAEEIISFSWRDRREATFTLPYASLFTNLMAHYPTSAEPFLRDLSSERPLSPSEQDAVCRILIDMPETATWKEDAARILPRYKDAAKGLLTQDLRSSDEDRRFRAELWMQQLQLNSPAPVTQQQTRRARAPVYDDNREPVEVPRRVHVDGPPVAAETEVKQPPRPPLSIVQPPPVMQHAYSGPTSGTYESTGNPIPQNAEFVVRNIPMLKLRLDYDTKIWDARLVPGEGNTQRLLVRNKSAGPQKHCVVRWTVIP